MSFQSMLCWCMMHEKKCLFSVAKIQIILWGFFFAFIISVKRALLLFFMVNYTCVNIYIGVRNVCLCSFVRTFSLCLRPLGFDFRVFCIAAKVCNLCSVCFTSMLGGVTASFNVGLWAFFSSICLGS